MVCLNIPTHEQPCMLVLVPGISNALLPPRLPKFSLSFEIQLIFHAPKLYITNLIYADLTSIRIKLTTIIFPSSCNSPFWLSYFCRQQPPPCDPVQNP